MSNNERIQPLADAWDHVYALDPELREEAFAIVRANTGQGYTDESGSTLVIPEDVHLVTPQAVDQIEAAIATIEELDGKGARSG